MKVAINFSGSVRDLFVPCEVRFYMLTKIFYVIAKGNMGFIKRRGVWLREWVSLTLVADPIIIAWVLVGLGFKPCFKNHWCMRLFSELRWLMSKFMSWGLHLSQIWKSSTNSNCDFLHLSSADEIGLIRTLSSRPLFLYVFSDADYEYRGPGLRKLLRHP